MLAKGDIKEAQDLCKRWSHIVSTVFKKNTNYSKKCHAVNANVYKCVQGACMANPSPFYWGIISIQRAGLGFTFWTHHE